MSAHFRGPIAVTPGDPAGIGPDVLLQLISAECALPIVAIADETVLQERAKQLGLSIHFQRYTGQSALDVLSLGNAGPTLWVRPVKLAMPIQAGHPNPAYAQYILETLQVAVAGCQSGQFSALTTGPINKRVMNTGGIPFTGHTEWLAQQTNCPLPVMLFITPQYKVALATTHIPLRDVHLRITKDHIINVVNVIKANWHRWFDQESITLHICGLNPHAGDGGYLGSEEMDEIIPAIDVLQQPPTLNIKGPLSADTAFIAENAAKADVILAMYHDQALPVIKTSSFGQAVNMTLGLPWIRTSVDHGTAYDLAGTGKAQHTGLLAAIHCAMRRLQ